MIDHDPLRLRMNQLATDDDDGAWRDVLARVQRKRHRRRRLEVGIVAIAALVIAAPALGLAVRMWSFEDGERANAPVVQSFETLDVGAPPGEAPGALASNARRVVLDASGSDHALWVAPTERGGFCFFFEGFLGGCQNPEPQTSAAAPGEVRPHVIGGVYRTDASGAASLIGGALTSAVGTHVFVELSDDTRIEVPVTWVSAPIGGGFFLVKVDASNRTKLRRPVALVAKSDDGALVARQIIYPAGG